LRVQRWRLAIHGGAGIIQRHLLSADQDCAYRASLLRVVEAGAQILARGGTALDAVETAVRMLEDDLLFNAGRGAVFAANGCIEMDASIMDGRTLAAGAVAGITRTRHPISLARCVKEHSHHVMLIGSGAEAFSAQHGLEQVEPGWFYTHTRWQALLQSLTEKGLPHPSSSAGSAPPVDPAEGLIHHEGKSGTVGAVALDCNGNVAAGTSTGGTNGKRAGRVGDSAIIGAGTYAANASCAVSATGSGEHLIRIAAAREICALIEHNQLSLQQAATIVIHGLLANLGAAGGVVAVTSDGQVTAVFNTPGMYRALMGSDLRAQIALYSDEP
jgi:L-asparaginase / beta-aspartyl-peptidase